MRIWMSVYGKWVGRFAVASTVCAVTWACLPAQVEASAGKSTPFRKALEERIKEGRFDCEGFSALEKQACEIHQVARHLSGYTSEDKYAFYYALEAINRVTVMASSPRFSMIKKQQGSPPNPGMDAEHILAEGYGICGNQTALFVALAEKVGLQARPVQFFYYADKMRQSHIAAEVYYGRSWHYFDSTWGTFFLTDAMNPYSVAPASRLADHKKLTRVENATQPWAYWLRAYNAPDPFAFLDGPFSVIYNYDTGEIALHDVDPESGIISLSNINNYVGDAQDNGRFTGIALSFPPLAGERDVALDIASVTGCDARAKICVNSTCRTLEPKAQKMHFSVRDAKRIYIQSPKANQCYALFNSIRFSTQKK